MEQWLKKRTGAPITILTKQALRATIRANSRRDPGSRPVRADGGDGLPLQVAEENIHMCKVENDRIEVKLTSGPDRLGWANALFEMDETESEVRPAYFGFDEKLGELRGVSVILNQVSRESGRQVKQFCFEGFISERARERSGYALSGRVTGYFNLRTNQGWLRFTRI